jgi:Ca2+-binding RTX toxin-like protein
MDTSPRDNGSDSNAPGQGGGSDNGFPKSNPGGGRPLGMPAIIMLALAAIALVSIVIREQTGSVAPVSWDEFVRVVKAGNVAEVRISGNSLDGLAGRDTMAGSDGNDTYVPWIVVNDRHSTSSENAVISNMVRYVCSIYKGTEKIAACK